ncbi:hypothetical protein [Marivita sp. GX14005]|uniref:hypothetical protein n=1 Tax=Marivita sp. GX14005 TaxID=2942276 RepID=UPI002019D268|nr:hypothetical protein [Marivita sp. GX14005]MCL3883685.1 hypothetical protein [Marivita sp. GX14005]
MQDYGVDKLADAFSRLKEETMNQTIADAFACVYTDNSGISNQIYVTLLFQDSIREIAKATIGERAKNRAISKLTELHISFQKALNGAPNWAKFREGFDFDAIIYQLNDLSDLLDTAGAPKSIRLDRQEIISDTHALIDRVRAQAIPQKAKQSAAALLFGTIKIIDEGAYLSDEQVASVIKSTTADLLAILNELEVDQSHLIKDVISWGKSATKATAFALGFLVDGRAAIEMLSAEKTPLAIAAPPRQIGDDTHGDQT